MLVFFFFFFFNDTATTEIYTLSLHDALPIFADFSAFASSFWLRAMTAGVAVAKPGVLPAMRRIVAAFMLINATLERLIGSWLERLLARRRTRELFLGLFVLSMVSLNFLSPLMRRYGASLRPVFLRLLPYFVWFPPSL